MISTRPTRSLLALAASVMSLVAFTGAALAEAPELRQGGGHWMLQRHDTDGDGTISQQEFRAATEALFARLDPDGEGRISIENMAAKRDAARSGQRPERRMHRGFARMDADDDGFISKAEFDDAHMARFNALDANGNGVIDADEVPAHKRHYKRHDRSGHDEL